MPLLNLTVKCMFKFIRNCRLPAIHALHPCRHSMLVGLHNFSRSNMRVVVSYCGFICILLTTHAFDAFICHLYSFFADTSVHIFYPFLKFRVFFLVIELYEFLFSGYMSLSDLYLTIILLILIFYFHNGLSKSGTFNFDELQLTTCFLYGLYIWYPISQID